MGARYSLNLYFPVERSEDVLTYLMHMADPPDDRKKTVSLYEGREISVPFVSRFDSGQTMTMRQWDPSIELDLALLFPADEAILACIDPQCAAPPGDLVPVGCFYTGARFGNEYSCFQFTAATKAMGHLFLKSPSVEKQFLELLEQCHGLFGVIDLDEDNLLEHPVFGNLDRKIRPQHLPYVDEEAKLLLLQFQ